MNVQVEFAGNLTDLSFNSLIGMTPERMSMFSELAGAQMVESTITRFENQASPEGVPWLPSMRAIVQSGETLRDTGRLMNSLTYIPLPEGVEWGTNVIYAATHQLGATIRARNAEFLKFKTAYGWRQAKEVKIPARPFLGVNANDIEELKDIVAYVLESNE